MLNIIKRQFLAKLNLTHQKEDGLGRYVKMKEGRLCREVDFGNMMEQLGTNYLDRYEGVKAEIHQISQFSVNIAVSTTY